jgi:hypothetical protein
LLASRSKVFWASSGLRVHASSSNTLIMNTGIFTLAIVRGYLRVRAKWSYPLAQLPFAGRAELAVRINGHPVCRRQASP